MGYFQLELEFPVCDVLCGSASSVFFSRFVVIVVVVVVLLCVCCFLVIFLFFCLPIAFPDLAERTKRSNNYRVRSA